MNFHKKLRSPKSPRDLNVRDVYDSRYREIEKTSCDGDEMKQKPEIDFSDVCSVWCTRVVEIRRSDSISDIQSLS